MRIIVLIIISSICLWCCGPRHEATQNLQGDVSVAMKIRPMFGIHSDWHRRLSIASGWRSTSAALMEDTGWWRGSHLYLHTSGMFLLHEGQAGCIGFTVAPPKIDEHLEYAPNSPISCDKHISAAGTEGHSKGFPASKLYSDLYYIGRFIETGSVPELRAQRRHNPIVFQSHTEHPETELPDILR